MVVKSLRGEPNMVTRVKRAEGRARAIKEAVALIKTGEKPERGPGENHSPPFEETSIFGVEITFLCYLLSTSEC